MIPPCGFITKAWGIPAPTHVRHLVDKLILLITENTCPMVETKPNSDVSSINANVGSVVTQTCHHGYLMIDNNSSMTVNCRKDGNWNGTLHNCERKWTISSITKIKMTVE